MAAVLVASPAAAGVERLAVDAAAVGAPISPLLYGQFIEHLGKAETMQKLGRVRRQLAAHHHIDLGDGGDMDGVFDLRHPSNDRRQATVVGDLENSMQAWPAHVGVDHQRTAAGLRQHRRQLD